MLQLSNVLVLSKVTFLELSVTKNEGDNQLPCVSLLAC
jgi:hypothetical protein